MERLQPKPNLEASQRIVESDTQRLDGTWTRAPIPASEIFSLKELNRLEEQRHRVVWVTNPQEVKGGD